LSEQHEESCANASTRTVIRSQLVFRQFSQGLHHRTVCQLVPRKDSISFSIKTSQTGRQNT
jgi:hypothetical protein